MIISKGSQMVNISNSDILYCEADGKYTKIVAANGEIYLKCKCLKDFEQNLRAKNFYRVHRKFLVNVDHILEYSIIGGKFLLLVNNVRIPISARRKPGVLDYIKRNIG